MPQKRLHPVSSLRNAAAPVARSQTLKKKTFLNPVSNENVATQDKDKKGGGLFPNLSCPDLPIQKFSSDLNKRPSFLQKTQSEEMKRKMEKAARVIQTHYRLYRVRCHYKRKLILIQKKSLSMCFPVSSQKKLLREESENKSITSLDVTIKPEIQKSAEPWMESVPLSNASIKKSSLSVGSSHGIALTKASSIAIIEQFQDDPDQAIESLCQSMGLSDFNPQKVAEYLFSETRLNKKDIGEYLGLGKEKPMLVMRQFMKFMDFTNVEFHMALRQLLTKFRLPGEAQKIDRIMLAFAERYCENNPYIFSCPDTGYILAFSVIMLNTDIHNPNVRKKMTLEQFIRNNRGIDNGKDLPETYLRLLYYEIATNEIKMNDFDKADRLKGVLQKIIGKTKDYNSPDRVYVGDFACVEVPDVQKYNSHKHLRVIFLFNDMIIVTKPKQGNTKFELRYAFELFDVKVDELEDNIYHRNLVLLSKRSMPILYLSFRTMEEKKVFTKNASSKISECLNTRRAARAQLDKQSKEASQKAKAMLEEIYADGVKSSPILRYKKFGSNLRDARKELKNQTLFRSLKTEATSSSGDEPSSFDLMKRLSFSVGRRRNTTIG